MMIDMLIEGIRMVVILVSFFTLSGQRFFEQERKQSIAIIVLIIVCVLLRGVSFSDIIIRFVYEIELLVFYILICYKKERWLHLMYMFMAYLAMDIAYVLMAVATRWLTDIFPEESYSILEQTTILVLYVVLILLCPKVMSFLRHGIGKITSTFFCEIGRAHV